MINNNILEQLRNDHEFNYYILSNNRILINSNSQSFIISRKMRTIELSEILRRC